MTAQSYPDRNIPLGDAFAQALTALEDCGSTARLISEATSEDERDDLINEYNAKKRRVERLMRNAIADGELHTFIKVPNGQIERLTEREDWRKEAFGVPDLGNVPHHLINPGVDTGGQPVLLEIDNFQDWLTTRRHAIDPFRTGAPGKPSAIRVIEDEHQRRITRGEAIDSVGEEAAHLKDWLDRSHPGAPKTTKKTIENRIRAAHRRRASK
jgi:hypothetical protein